MLRWALILLVILTSGCTGGGFNLKTLAKSDIDMVADIHYQTAETLLRDLTWKLYRRNTGEWRKSGLSLEVLTAQIFEQRYDTVRRRKLGGVSGVAAIELGLSPDYRGDRIFALMCGLQEMIAQSYGYQREFFFINKLDGQKLYNSARNVEVLVWRLSTLRDQRGTPIILTNNLPQESPNLSYERLFGKLIGNQDMLAVIVAQKNDRVIKTVVHNVATMVFLPI